MTKKKCRTFHLSFNVSLSMDKIFNFYAEMQQGNIETLIADIKEYYEDFDPDYEAYLWIGEDEHGKKGAPYHIKDIVADMEDAEKMILWFMGGLVFCCLAKPIICIDIKKRGIVYLYPLFF